MKPDPISITLSPGQYASVERMAREAGLGVEEWAAQLVARQVAGYEAAEAFFRERAGRSRPGALQALLDRVPDGPPVPGDELPDGFERRDRGS